MPKLNFSRTHDFSSDKINARADVLVKKLKEKMASLGMDYTWRQDKSGIDFTGNGFKGTFDIKPTEVNMLIDLSLMLAPFKGMVEGQIEKALDKLVKKD